MRLRLATAALAAAALMGTVSAAPPHLTPFNRLLSRQNGNGTTAPPETDGPGMNTTQGEPRLNATTAPPGNTTTGSNSTDLRCATTNGEAPFSNMYREPLRPQIHYSPSSGFSSGPNGLVRINDTWHLFFLYNSNGSASNQSWAWGHSTSPDLLTWTNQPIALAPEGTDEGTGSGSVVLDLNNSSGLFSNDTNPDSRIVLIYTFHSPMHQDQHIAYGDGFNFTKQDPAITADEQAQFSESAIRWNGTAWIAALAQSQASNVSFYTSPDLANWTELSSFSGGLQVHAYDALALEQLPAVGGPRDGEMLNMLLVSSNLGAPRGGSVQQVFLGDFDPQGSFAPLDNFTHVLDWGEDLRAAQTAYQVGPEVVMIAAVGNSEYAQQVPTANETGGWRGEMTLARTLSAVWTEMTPQYSAYGVAQAPYNLTPISGQDLAPVNLSGNVTVELRGEGAFNIQAAFSVPASFNFTQPSFNFTSPAARLRVRSNGAGNLTFGANFGLPVVVWADRRKAGVQWADQEVFFTDRFSHAQMPLRRVPGDNATDYVVTMQLVVDRIISELFVNNGTSTATLLTFWDDDETPAFVDLELVSPDISLDSFSVVPLNSTWDCEAST